MFDFYNNLFKSNKRSSKHDIAQFFSLIQITRLTQCSLLCEISIYEDEPIYALKNMSKNKSPSNDGLTEKIYETFWDESET